MDKGVSSGKVFAALMKGEGKGFGAPTPPAPAPKIPIGAEVYKIEPGTAPQVGGKEPKITLIEFSDFQCPYCSRAKGTLDELQKIYKNDLQITFRHYPLPFHNNATPAAIAAVAAAEQGKFWQMHDKLFANQQALASADLDKYATEIGLDMAKFKAAMDNPKTKAQVESDTKMGSNFGVGGTPAFFLNGRSFSGAYPLDSFKRKSRRSMPRSPRERRARASTPRSSRTDWTRPRPRRRRRAPVSRSRMRCTGPRSRARRSRAPRTLSSPSCSSRTSSAHSARASSPPSTR